MCGIEEWATLALSHSCGEGCLHPVSLPIAYTADYVKAACSEASADALTWADVYATHPTEIVIDPKSRSQNGGKRVILHTKNRALSGSVSENRDAVGPHDNLHPCRWVASLPFLCFQLPPCILQQGGRPAIRGRSMASLIQIVGPCGAGVHAHRSLSKQDRGAYSSSSSSKSSSM